MKLSSTTKYYLITIPFGIIFWLILQFFGIEFVNIIFFIMAYIWHFSLMAPKVKEMALTSRNKFSMLAVVFKFNFYLQMFIHIKDFKYTSSLVRAISPFVFTVFLYLVGGSGNFLFTILGSFMFELIYLGIMKKIITNTVDLETPPMIPNEESSRE